MAYVPPSSFKGRVQQFDFKIFQILFFNPISLSSSQPVLFSQSQTHQDLEFVSKHTSQPKIRVFCLQLTGDIQVNKTFVWSSSYERNQTYFLQEKPIFSTKPYKLKQWLKCDHFHDKKIKWIHFITKIMGFFDYTAPLGTLRSKNF